MSVHEAFLRYLAGDASFFVAGTQVFPSSRPSGLRFYQVLELKFSVVPSRVRGWAHLTALPAHCRVTKLSAILFSVVIPLASLLLRPVEFLFVRSLFMEIFS